MKSCLSCYLLGVPSCLGRVGFYRVILGMFVRVDFFFSIPIRVVQGVIWLLSFVLILCKIDWREVERANAGKMTRLIIMEAGKGHIFKITGCQIEIVLDRRTWIL